MLIPKKRFVVARMNQAVHLSHPVTSLRMVKTKEVLLSADAKTRTVTVELIRISKGFAWSTGTSYMCSPKPLLTDIVDIMAGAKTASYQKYGQQTRISRARSGKQLDKHTERRDLHTHANISM